MGIILSLAKTRRIESANFVAEPAGTLHPDRCMRVHDFLYTISGRREIFEDGVRYETAPGDVLVLAAGRHHYAQTPAPTALRSAYVHCLSEEGDRANASARPGISGDSVCLPTRIETGGDAAVRNLFEETVYLARSSRPLSRMKARALFTVLIAELACRAASNDGAASKPVDYVIDRIERNPEKNDSLDDFARRVGMNRRTLTRQFRLATGKSLAAFRTGVKIRNACAMLRANPHLSVRDVAGTLGFYDEYHFSRVFKAAVGRSPSDYKKHRQ